MNTLTLFAIYVQAKRRREIIDYYAGDAVAIFNRSAGRLCTTPLPEAQVKLGSKSKARARDTLMKNDKRLMLMQVDILSMANVVSCSAVRSAMRLNFPIGALNSLKVASCHC